MTNLNQYENLVARYLNGAASDEEKNALYNLLNDSPEFKKTFLELKDIWDATRKTNAGADLKLFDFYKKQADAKQNFPLLFN